VVRTINFANPPVAVTGKRMTLQGAEHRGRVSRGGGPWSRIGAAPESSQDGTLLGKFLGEDAATSRAVNTGTRFALVR
jgi:hypothetical protein